jgi:hypothetical protein
MIRLTSILLEAEQQLIKALFIGDIQTVSSTSFARKLLRTPLIDGQVDGRANASISDLELALQNNVLENFDVVTIFPGLIYKEKSADTIIQTLTTMFSLVKEYNCVLVAITNTTAEFTDKPELYKFNNIVSDWISKQTISDVTIDTTEFSDLDFIKSGRLLDSDAQNIIAQQWISDTLPKINNDLVTIDSTEIIPLDDDSIKELQTKLLSLGYFVGPNEVDGKLNQYTTSALVKFQRDSGVDVTGEYDKQTAEKLEKTLKGTTKDDEWKLANLVPTNVKHMYKQVAGDIATADDIIDFFVDKGLSVAGAAGIAGNLFVESGFKTYNLGDHGTSNGLAQWHNDRWTGPNGFEAWCSENGHDPWSVDGQLEFLWWELTTRYNSLVTDLKNEDITPSSAAFMFAQQFERPSVISPMRKLKAEEFFNDYSSFF